MNTLVTALINWYQEKTITRDITVPYLKCLPLIILPKCSDVLGSCKFQKYRLIKSINCEIMYNLTSQSLLQQLAN